MLISCQKESTEPSGILCSYCLEGWNDFLKIMVNRAIEFVSFLDALGVALVITLIPFFTKELGVGAFGFGAITSLYGFCQIIGGSIIGYLSNGILSRKMILLISSIGSGVSYALLLIRGSITSLVFSRVLVGLIKQSTTSCKVCFSHCVRNRHWRWWVKTTIVHNAFPLSRPFAIWVLLYVSGVRLIARQGLFFFRSLRRIFL